MKMFFEKILRKWNENPINMVKERMVLMNINVRGSSALFLFSSTSMLNGGLKSTEDKLERQKKRDDQITFFEKQKESLKDMVCDTVEDISRKLDMLHSYEDQIQAARAEYNNGQMSHVLDEARELGEKIAEEAEKQKPKTEEERKEELIEEATGEEDNKNSIQEAFDEVLDMVDEIQEEILEEQFEAVEKEAEMTVESSEQMEQPIQDYYSKEELTSELFMESELRRLYKSIDVQI